MDCMDRLAAFETDRFQRPLKTGDVCVNPDFSQCLALCMKCHRCHLIESAVVACHTNPLCHVAFPPKSFVWSYRAAASVSAVGAGNRRAMDPASANNAKCSASDLWAPSR